MGDRHDHPRSSSSTDAQAILRQDAQIVQDYFAKLSARLGGAPARLIESIEYSIFAGGKRLRPALLLESFHACSAAEDNDARGWPSAVAAAAAIELIHTFSLVHDDLPAMDDDDLRRGKPTNHKVFGEAIAILAGDAMITLAFELLATDTEPDLAPVLIRQMATATGPRGMIGGQVLDMAAEHRSIDIEALREIHRLKTGALLIASCRAGAICARADQGAINAIGNFGEHLGLAFQIVDDILDVTSTPDQLGKQTHKDASQGKNTFPTLLGLDESRAEAERQIQAALAAVEPLGAAADALRCLARFVVQRAL